MIYNILLDTVKTNILCITCKMFDTSLKQCNGLGKICFEMDEKTKTLIDPVTKLPIKLERGETK